VITQVRQLQQWLVMFYQQFIPSVLAVGLLFFVYQWTQSSEHLVQDELIRSTAKPLGQQLQQTQGGNKQVGKSPVVLVHLDEASEKLLHQRYWQWRSQHLAKKTTAPPTPLTPGSPPVASAAPSDLANLLEQDDDAWMLLDILKQLHQASPKVVTINTVLPRIALQGNQPYLKALLAYPNVVFGINTRQETGLRSKALALSTAWAQLNIGAMDLVPDNDGVIRRIWPFFDQTYSQTESGIKTMYPSLALSTALKYGLSSSVTAAQSQSPTQASPTSHSKSNWLVDLTKIEDIPVLSIIDELTPSRKHLLQLDNLRAIRLLWAKANGNDESLYFESHPSIPLCRFYDACPTGQKRLTPDDLAQLRHSIVILDRVGQELKPTVRTPLSKLQLHADVIATGIDTILNANPIRTASGQINAILLLSFALSIFYLRLKLKSLGACFLFMLFMMLAYAWIARICLESGLLIDIVTPEVFFLLAFTVGSLVKSWIKDKDYRALQRNMSQLVPKTVFQEIQKQGFELKAGGERMVITSMFVDLRRFTTMAEHMEPDAVTKLLNGFYGVVEGAAFERQGTVDKFMGDGALLIFGAPLPSATHAEDALATARLIIERSEKLFDQWERQKRITPQIHAMIDIGVSMSSGNAFVGFLGPGERLEYTAVGDVVNLCVRLQEQAKIYDTQLIVSEATVQLLPEKDIKKLAYIDDVRVRGREMAIGIYTETRYRGHITPDTKSEGGNSSPGQTSSIKPAMASASPPPLSKFLPLNHDAQAVEESITPLSPLPPPLPSSETDAI